MNRRRLHELFLYAGDFLVLLAGLALALALRRSGGLSWESFSTNGAAFGPVFLAWLATFYVIGLYDPRRSRDITGMLGGLLLASGVNAGLGVAHFYLFAPALGVDFTPKSHLALSVVLGHVLLLPWRRLWLGLLSSGPMSWEVAFLGTSPLFEEVRRELARHPEFGFRAAEARGPATRLLVADTRWVEEHWDEAKEALAEAAQGRVPVLGLDEFYEQVMHKVSPEHAADPVWTIDYALSRTGRPYASVKRALDLAAASLLLLLASPFLALVALAVRLLDGAPVFYAQPRLGLLGREFRVWKFRTMVVAADAAGPFSSARRTDARITRLGALLRRTRLDELPQLWNVLRGEMSLVGPRPEWMKEVEVLEQALPHYHLRHLVPPGITGWAQVNFRATNNAADSLEKLRYDLYYVKNQSFALDLGILLKTIKRVFVSDVLPAADAPRPDTPAPSGRAVKDYGALVGRGGK